MKITGEELIRRLKAHPDVSNAFLLACKPGTVFDLPDPVVTPDKLLKHLTQQNSEK